MILDALTKLADTVNSTVQWPVNTMMKATSKTAAKIGEMISKPIKTNDVTKEIQEIGSTIKNKSANKQKTPEATSGGFMDYPAKPMSTGRIGYIGSMGNAGVVPAPVKDTGWMLSEDRALSNLTGSRYVMFNNQSIIKHNSLIHIANSRINGNPIYSYIGDGVNILNDTGYEWYELT
jgi:hypothetical protein